MKLQEMGKRALEAKYAIQKLSTKEKNKALEMIAEELILNTSYILEENKKDIVQAENINMHPGLIDRLKLDKERVKNMSEGLLQICDLEDPIGENMQSFTRPNGLQLQQVRVPFGVIGIIYESRPNVTVDAFGLCFKTSNIVILKGGSDAIHSNIALTNIIQMGLKKANLSEDMIQLIKDTNRETTATFMKMKEYIDVLIPRGSASLIQAVVKNATIPIIETGTGNCHIYVEESADFKKAIPIIINAKTQRIGVCNACESLVIDRSIAPTFLPLLQKELYKKNVEIRGDAYAKSILSDITLATEEDFAREYLDYIISIKTVSSSDEAIKHINQYNTKHSDAIITENKEISSIFLRDIDSSCVYVNASTRFSDGFVFGFGAEIGISTQKLHARGPMGLIALTTYKYQIIGTGQIRE
jgi:glutamate-5-semialdehyde dehydrogenase